MVQLSYSPPLTTGLTRDLVRGRSKTTNSNNAFILSQELAPVISGLNHSTMSDMDSFKLSASLEEHEDDVCSVERSGDSQMTEDNR